MKIRFYNNHNLVIPLLDHTLIKLNEQGIAAAAYISYRKYRGSIKGQDMIDYFEKSRLTRFFSFSKRANQISYVFAASFKVLFGSAGLNVFFTQPPLFVIWAAWLSRLKGTPYLIHVQDLYPDYIAKLNILNEDRWLYKWLDSKSINALRHAEEVIVIGACMKQKILKKKIDPNKIVDLKNITSTQKVKSISNQLENLKINGKFTILYAGNMGLSHEFETLLTVASYFSERQSDIHFLFIASGRRRYMVEDYIKTGKTNVSLISSIPQKMFDSLLQETDLHYISLKMAFNGVMVPSKFYSSLAMGKPIIFEGSQECELALEIDKHNLGIAVKDKDEIGLREAFLHFYNQPEKLNEVSQNVNSYFDKQCSVALFLENYMKILNKHID